MPRHTERTWLGDKGCWPLALIVNTVKSVRLSKPVKSEQTKVRVDGKSWWMTG